ncbi:MAG: fibronectin type III domain-containing protein, partial [bacterium]
MCEWSGNTTSKIGTTSKLIGAGYANTSAMIAQSNVAGKAATVARAFQGGGKTDWYLPSKDELTQAYLQKPVIGSFASVDYWSSSETEANDAWFYGFYGYGDNALKSVTFSVHPVRAFSDVATVAATTASTATSVKVTGLNKGTAYTFRVAAINDAGQGAWSGVSGISTPHTVPGQPITVTGDPGDKKVDLKWIAPSANGSDITTYVVNSCIDTKCTLFVHDANPATQLTVTGLTNGTTYTFTVAATNGIGTGQASAPSAPITPRTVPGAPTGVTGSIDNDGKVVVQWTAPTDNGGNTIKDYIVKACIGETCAVAAESTTNTLSATLSGLSLRTSYTFIVVAKNDAGPGPDSKKSAPATLQKLPSVPDKPTAEPDTTGGVVVKWVAPDDGGVDISDYVVEYCDASNACKPFGHTASTIVIITVTGLAVGSPFTFKVQAKNAVGLGGFSLNSDAAIPRVVPDAPTNVEAAANDEGVIALIWSAPEFTGGAPLTGYAVQACTGQKCEVVAQINSAEIAAVSINELITGTLYTFKVAAQNIAGVGAYSDASTAISPRSLPGAPRSVVADANNTGGIRVTWVVPLSNGGIDITGYEVQSCIDGECSDAATSNGEELAVVVEKLTLGKAYTFKVAAKNSIGLGGYSAPSNEATPRTPPPAPTAVTAVVNNVGG